MKNKRRVKIIVGIQIIVVIFLLVFVFSKSSSTGNVVNTKQVDIVPLSPEEKQKVIQTILSSEFIKDVPKKDPVALVFFNFANGQKIWQDGFLIGQNQLLSQGEPSVYLTLHSKYIHELNNNNLCEIIQKANNNGDLGFESEYSKARLLIKYSSMLKHRACFES